MKPRSSNKGKVVELSIYRRAEAAQLLEWSRSLEDHKKPLEEWSNDRSLREARTIDQHKQPLEAWKHSLPTSLPPQHTKSRKGI